MQNNGRVPEGGCAASIDAFVTMNMRLVQVSARNSSTASRMDKEKAVRMKFLKKMWERTEERRKALDIPFVKGEEIVFYCDKISCFLLLKTQSLTF